MQRPSPESDLRCWSCRAVGKPASGHLTLGIDAVDGVATVHSVEFFCSERCLTSSKALWEREQTELYALADFDPYVHLEETIPKYAWARGTIERFARMLSAVTPWKSSLTPSDTGSLLESLPGSSSSSAPPRRTDN